MKSIFTLLILIVSIGYIHAQTLPNGDFENWTTHNAYEEPTDFFTSNSYSHILQQPSSVTKVTDATDGSYAAKLTTTITAQDTLFGFVSNGNIVNNDLMGGVPYPYTTMVDSVSFQAKFNLLNQDTALFIMMFKYGGQAMGMVYVQMTGSQSSYQLRKEKITWFTTATVMPDTMLFVFASSNPDTYPTDGSWLQVDDLKIDNQSVTNGSFENWTQKSYEDIDSWNTFNMYSTLFKPAYIEKSTDAQSGSYALELTTQIYNNGEDTIAHFSNGDLFNDNFSSGMLVYQNPKKITGYYKYTPVGNDSALVAVRAWGPTQIGPYQNIDNNIIKLGASSTYKYFEIPLHYNAWPLIDTLGIGFASSNIFDGKSNVQAGSKLLIDNVKIEYQTVGINENSDENSAKVYPNPASNRIHFELTNFSASSLIVYDASGKHVLQQELSNPEFEVSNLEQGLYFYSLQMGDKQYRGKFSVLR